MEFRKLILAAQDAVNRTEALYSLQKEFVGNASHELQTPLALHLCAVNFEMNI